MGDLEYSVEKIVRDVMLLSAEAGRKEQATSLSTLHLRNEAVRSATAAILALIPPDPTAPLPKTGG